MSARAAAQLELIGFSDLFHYMRGKADWIVRGLPTEPRAPLAERLRAFPYFVNNLAPSIRNAWIRLSRRVTVGAYTRDGLVRLQARDPVPVFSGPAGLPAAVVLNSEGVLLGAIDREGDGRQAWQAMNPAPQTIRPDMTLELASWLLRSNRYLLVTTATGHYIGQYRPAAK